MAEMPREGFLKVVALGRARVSSSERAALIRKGNQLFNSGDIETAKRVFISLGYTDGIIRLGDYYYKNAEFFEAYRMYSLAPAPSKISHMIERMAGVVRKWISE